MGTICLRRKSILRLDLWIYSRLYHAVCFAIYLYIRIYSSSIENTDWSFMMLNAGLTYKTAEILALPYRQLHVTQNAKKLDVVYIYYSSLKHVT